jgi:hypothetical protein
VLQKPLSHREEYLKQKRKQRRIKYLIASGIFFVLFGLVSFASYRPQVRISHIELSGGVLVEQKDVESATMDFLQGSYFWFFPKNSAFLYQKSKLEKNLREKFPRIENIAMSLKDFHTLAITIKEHKQNALWCDTVPSSSTFDTNTNEHCYFMNVSGLIFSPAPNFSGDAYFKYYGLISQETPIGRQYIASSTEFANISDFILDIRKLSIRPQYLVAEDNSEFTLFLSGGSKIYFDTKIPLTRVAQNLSALLRNSAFATSTDGNLPVDYIDLRYGNKLFYKLK